MLSFQFLAVLLFRDIPIFARNDNELQVLTNVSLPGDTRLPSVRKAILSALPDMFVNALC